MGKEGIEEKRTASGDRSSRQEEREKKRERKIEIQKDKER